MVSFLLGDLFDEHAGAVGLLLLAVGKPHTISFSAIEEYSSLRFWDIWEEWLWVC